MNRWQRVALYAACVLGILALLVGIAASRSPGTATNTASVTIARPPAVVFSWLIEPAKRTQWIGGLQESRWPRTGLPQVGDKRIDVAGQNDERTEWVTEVSAIEADRLLESKSVTPTYDQTMRFELTPNDGSTLLTLAGHTTFKTWLGRLLAPTIQKSAQTKIEQDLQNLKTKIETAP
jgi:uncharacterized protein YndB with AHSA1/START domain